MQSIITRFSSLWTANDLMNLANVAAGTHTLGLSNYSLAPNTTYQLFVEAIGVPSMLNRMSSPVGYMPQAARSAERRAHTERVQWNGSPVHIRFHREINLYEWTDCQLDYKLR